MIGSSELKLRPSDFGLLFLFFIAFHSLASGAAETGKEAELQARIEALEKKLEEPPKAEKASIDRLKYKGVELKLGGFLASSTVYRNHNNESDIGTNFSKIPFANSAGYDQAEFRGSARQSRFSLLVQGDVDSSTHLSSYYELDFMGTSPTGNLNQSNSFTPRTRHVYMTADWDETGLHLLAGQNWSLVTLNNKGISPRNEYVPQTIDSLQAVGFDWTRQWQMRIVKDWEKKYWLGLSLENSQTVNVAGTVNPGTGNTYQLPAGASFTPSNMSINTYPDIILKAAAETEAGHFEAYNLLRSFQSRYGGPATASQTNKQQSWASAVGAGLIVPLIPKTLDISASTLAGRGIGRYGTSGLSDATYAEDGSLNALSGLHYLVQLAWHASPQWEVWGAYGEERLDEAVGSSGGFGYGNGIVATNAGCSSLGGTCAPQLKSLNQSNLGFWWSFYKGDFGVAKLGFQFSHTTLQTFADASGLAPTTSQDMVFTSLRFFPF